MKRNLPPAWMSRSLLSGCLAGLATTLLLGCSRTVERVAPIGETFPTVQAERLSGEALEIPEDLSGEPALLLVGYVQDSQFDIDRWLLGLAQAGTQVQVLEVPTIRGWVPRVISGTIDSGMRRGIPEEDWRSVATVYGDAGTIIDFLGNEEPLSARAVLLDAEGRVVWAHDDGYSASALIELDDLIRSMTWNEIGTSIEDEAGADTASGAAREEAADMNENLERFKKAMNDVTADSLDLLPEIYDEDVRFVDPLHEIEGLEALRDYYARLYEGVAEIRFEFLNEVTNGEEISLVWIMHMRHKNFHPDEVLQLPGMSYVKFEDGKVTHHRDSFDVGAMIYERVPVLGGLVRHIKGRL